MMQTVQTVSFWAHPRFRNNTVLANLLECKEGASRLRGQVCFISAFPSLSSCFIVISSNYNYPLKALGPTTVEKIYVNPEGPITDQHNPKASAEDVRTAFSRMGFDDQTTVILIAGGHTIGKNHGPCPADEVVDGKCKGGEGTFTTGFNGAWTATPSTWSNQVSTYYISIVYKRMAVVWYTLMDCTTTSLTLIC